MPIKGLSDRNLSFPQIGSIRKGAKTEKTRPDGSKVSYPVDLKYFKVEFDAQEAEREATFRSIYGEKPTKINIRLPFNQIERMWDPYCEAYTAGRMVARSDGEYFEYLVNLTTGAMEVVNGVSVADGSKVAHREIIGKAGKTDIKCRPVGRLKVIIPELRSYAYLVVHTTSVIDIRSISEQLAGIQYANDGVLVGVPLILHRKPKMVSTPTQDGKRTRLEKWMLSIEVDPVWVAQKFAQLEMMALPAGAVKTALPDVAEDTPETDEEEWTAEEGAPDEQEPMPGVEDEATEAEYHEEEKEEKDPGYTIEPLRYEPEDLRNALILGAKKHAGEIISKGKVGLIASTLETALSFTTNPEASRKQLLVYLTGKDSLTKIENGMLVTLYNWLKPGQDSGGEWAADALAVREAIAAFNAAQPQQESLL